MLKFPSINNGISELGRPLKRLHLRIYSMPYNKLHRIKCTRNNTRRKYKVEEEEKIVVALHEIFTSGEIY